MSLCFRRPYTICADRIYCILLRRHICLSLCCRAQLLHKSMFLHIKYMSISSCLLVFSIPMYWCTSLCWRVWLLYKYRRRSGSWRRGKSIWWRKSGESKKDFQISTRAWAIWWGRFCFWYREFTSREANGSRSPSKKLLSWLFDCVFTVWCSGLQCTAVCCCESLCVVV